jgi:outer membrane immunogenic protein
MKRFVVAACLAVIAAFSSAKAADIAVKAPAPIAPVSNWTGLYIGAAAGIVSGFDPVWANALASANLDGKTSGTFGGTLGYNYQFGSILAGIEGDWSYANTVASTNTGGCAPATCRTTMRDYGTLRGRIGYLVMPTLLVYGTGGGAWASYRHTLLAFDDGTHESGAAYGGGVEWMFAPNWTAKFEYLRLDFGHTTAVAASPTTTASDLDANVFRVGFNYLFHWPR